MKRFFVEPGFFELQKSDPALWKKAAGMVRVYMFEAETIVAQPSIGGRVLVEVTLTELQVPEPKK